MRRKEGDKHGDLLRAACRVFARDGFDEAKVSAIAEQAGVATGSLYLYFEGKDALLDALFRRFWANLREDLDELPASDDPLERIRRILALFHDHLAADRDLAVVYLREHHRFAARRPDGFADHLACMELGERLFREASGHEVDAGTYSLSLAIVLGGVRAALEHRVSNSLPLNSAARDHMLLMSMAAIRVLAKGGAAC